MDDNRRDDDDRRTIDAGNGDTARMDHDNEKNIATPKAGANREAGMRIEQVADDIDERKRNELAGDELTKADGDHDHGRAGHEQGADARDSAEKNT